MEQFVGVALAHFVALLVPGVDFFLIARTTLTNGWRTATGTCLGIALANGVFITAAFGGISLVTRDVVLDGIQAAGGVFLVTVGIAFWRSTPHADVGRARPGTRASWVRCLGLGFASGILNPKNALFYVSLAAAVRTAQPMALVLYGSWMFTVVLTWDVFVAVVLGSDRARLRLSAALPRLTKLAGAVLVLFGAGMLANLAGRILGHG